LAALIRAINALDQRVSPLAEDVTTSLRTAAAVNEELQRINMLLDGLSKDLLASSHRLGSIEDEAHNSERKIDDLKEAVELRREAFDESAGRVGMATLIPNQPIAIFGTSLVVHSGPYGRFLLRQPDIISDHILAGSFWDSHLKPVIERAGRSDGSAIDAGAYLGFHSVYMSRFFRAVYAFEPQVEICHMLCANLLLNNCRNVTAVNGALYDTPGRLRLADNARQEIPIPVIDGAIDYDRVGNAAALTFQLTDESDPTGVDTQTIDQLGLTDLALIKVDTQGCDLHVLKGASATIQLCRPMITAEYERQMAQGHGDSLEDYYHYFDEMSYDVQVLEKRSDDKQVDLLATPR
jgi:FkbM family methyltransferase